MGHAKLGPKPLGAVIAVAAGVAGCLTALSAGGGGTHVAGHPAADSSVVLPAIPPRASLDAATSPQMITPVNAGGPGFYVKATTTAATAPPRQLIVPDLIGVLPAGISAAQVRQIRALAGVRAVLAVNGGEIKINGKPAGVLGVTASSFRSWTPPETAASPGIWRAFSDGELITSAQAARRLGLHRGGVYPVTAAVRTGVPFGGSALLGVPGVDAIADARVSSDLGLVRHVAILINAPGADLTTLTGRVRSVLGAPGEVVRLVPVVTPGTLPVDETVPSGRPTNYLMLYQESAADYCPGLSWTILAAIGEIESDDGQNMGPSSAGALGPMQFLPSTWAEWGIDAFGETGPPDIMDPLDAVPSAARMLCEDGAADGAEGLSQAIFDYNHADWYVSEVLALATEYAHEFTS
jgi:hypothetical protein